VLPKGTPVAQCVPIRRERWVAQTMPMSPEETQQVHDLTKALSRERGLYRRQFRA
jgi:antitoxin (DNA-binding transcriptional repressor) of toxin-antitoxin stability system